MLSVLPVQAAVTPPVQRLDHVQVNTILQQQGEYHLARGVFEVDGTIVLPAGARLSGAGRGRTLLRLQAGVNQNLIESEGFAQLTGTSQLQAAPSAISIVDLTLDGGYLSTDWADPTVALGNQKGHCIALYARQYDIDVEANNCPQNMLYSEGQGVRTHVEVDSNIRLTGRVSGESCLVFRGPADILLEKAILGTCGYRPPQLATATTYPAYDGVVIDQTPPYQGTLEIGFLHVYGVFNGYGLKTLGNPRLKASHVVSESNRGGIWLSEWTWGAMSLVDIHANGFCRMSATRHCQPALPYAGLRIDSRQGFTIGHAMITRMPQSLDSGEAIVLNGRGNSVQAQWIDVTHHAPTTPQIRLLGQHNELHLTGEGLPTALIDWPDHQSNRLTISSVVQP
jgi:hypothetical protein